MLQQGQQEASPALCFLSSFSNQDSEKSNAMLKQELFIMNSPGLEVFKKSIKCRIKQDKPYLKTFPKMRECPEDTFMIVFFKIFTLNH